ncbi:DUF4168 domain-containing protein [Marinobacter sp. HL-58]|uniref:DUF4168 domain-containing protein n=1 Tax=Marinobacter sp. HL-58 TaxID=1479237 RepID=UPI000482F060|nr:DUF4168 domain-containing protein [Marinobacter sp. HL-58]KPQ01592.1 MAG: protein of unknown function containing DUF4168 domain [Marinobacter sp. HL-58]
MNVYTRNIASLMCAAGLMFGASATALADEHDNLYLDEVADKAEELTADDVKSDHLEAFLKSSRELTEARKDYTGKMMEADGDENKIAELMEEAREEMASIVEENDLSVTEYKEIGYLIKDDDDLMDELNKVAASM